jgi:hypothetical protein
MRTPKLPTSIPAKAGIQCIKFNSGRIYFMFWILDFSRMGIKVGLFLNKNNHQI